MTKWILLFASLTAHAEIAPDFSEGAIVPEGGRGNLYQLSAAEFKDSVLSGKKHALQYPVDNTALIMPYEPIRRVIEGSPTDPFRTFLGKIFGGLVHIHSMNDLFAHAGLHNYPATQGQGVYFVPHPTNHLPQDRMGLSRIDRDGVMGFTISCAGCHSANLFGKRVVGMTNRFPKSNDFFYYGKKATQAVPPAAFAAAMGARRNELQLYRESRISLGHTETRRPLVDGLDTSLAQVSLSLSRRNPDAYATFNSKYEREPRAEVLRNIPADSKPAVWWNLKYKNRWLSDGSVVSGDPIFTNILWNEIGRGSDLQVVERWLNDNRDKVRDLGMAAFATEAPKWTDFFAAKTLAQEKVRRGHEVFNNRCARCHGRYENGEVRYPRQTRVIDVGTDAYRYQGMVSLAKGLNPLAISQNFGTVIKPQKGYVPPPLVGIWARWPYFHNNSIPNLCALLTRADRRPKVWWGGEANDKNLDFDSRCVGYPLGAGAPDAWAKDESKKFDVSRAGMSNGGHDEGIILKDGKELLTPENKWDLIEFLKTL